MSYYETAEYLLSKTKRRPEIGIICGSGLSGLAKVLEESETFNYENIPGFPKVTIQGHTGELVFGVLGGIEVVCLRGRFHYYEGHSMDTVALPVRVMRLLGVKLLIVTNAAGGLNSSYRVGDIAIIQDHFGMPIIAGNHPLRGENDDNLGPRFPAVSDAYNKHIHDLVYQTAIDLGLGNVIRQKATYCYVSGPAYESMAESRFLKSIGGDLVGMSTVPEVIVAKHTGMAILGLSLVTNEVVLEAREDTVHASHAEVLEAVNSSGRNVESIVRAFVKRERIGEFLSKLPAAPKTLPSKEKKDTKESCGAKDHGCCHTGHGHCHSGHGHCHVSMCTMVIGMIAAFAAGALVFQKCHSK